MYVNVCNYKYAIFYLKIACLKDRIHRGTISIFILFFYSYYIFILLVIHSTINTLCFIKSSEGLTIDPNYSKRLFKVLMKRKLK